MGTMGSEGVGGGGGGGGGVDGKQSQFQPLTRTGSMYNLTLDEVQNQLGDLGKPLSSMNLDEFLKSVWMAEVNQSMDIETGNSTAAPNQTTLQHQASLSLNGALSKKTVDEVWRDIQHGKGNDDRHMHERQSTLGEMTLEDFLVKAGIVADTALDDGKTDGPVVGLGQNAAQANTFPQQGSWMAMPYQHPHFQHMQQNVYMQTPQIPQQSIPPSLAMVPSGVIDVSYTENQMALSSPLVGTFSDTQVFGRKRNPSGELVEKTVERRQKRMIKNRESAARSRARKQAYTNELENKVSCLEEENKRLRKKKELEKMLPSTPPPKPKYQLRRTSSAPP